jgi:hypothetical protein
VDVNINDRFEGASVKSFDVSSRPLSDGTIGSRKRALEIFLSPPAPGAERRQRRLFEREARVSSLQRSEEVQGRKM